jgi:hypothetical protein
MKLKFTSLFLVLFVIQTLHVAQTVTSTNQLINFPKVSINIQKYGPYIGFQKGLYAGIEMGAEYQYKKVKLVKPITHALHAGVNYNLNHNYIGYDLGYWIKQGRLNFTYGATLIYRTNYQIGSLGISPVFGLKLTQFHFQTGVNLLSARVATMPVNRFYVSVRFVLIKNRDININNKE